MARFFATRNISLCRLGLGLLVALGAAALLALLAYLVDRARFDLRTLDERAERLVARSREMARRAGEFDQDRALAAQGTYRKNGSFYRFDDHVADAERDGPGGVPATSGAEDVLFRFEFDGADPVALRPIAGESRLEERDGVIRVDHRKGDYLVTSEGFSVSVPEVDSVVVRVRSKRGSQLDFFWGQGSAQRAVTLDDAQQMITDRKALLRVDLVPDGEFHTYQLNLKGLRTSVDDPEGALTGMVVEPSDVDGDEVEIDFIRFISRMSKYRGAGIGRGYERLGGQLRQGFFLTTDAALGYAVSIPENEPELVFGAGSLFGGSISLVIRLEASGEETVLLDEVVEGPEAWHDHRIDLSAWSGADARVRFEVRSAEPNVAFISNPALREKPRERFNVIVYLEDALRADHLSAYRYERETSPARDRFAAEGVLFENAFSQATMTRPSVPSLMTSLLPTATGVWNLSDFLRDAYLTLAEIFRHHGFETVSFIQNSNAGSVSGVHQGFSRIDDQNLLWGSTETVVDDFLKWLDENAAHNFFAYVHVIDPHGPYDPPPPYNKWLAPYYPAENGDPENATYDPDGRYDRLDPKRYERPSFEGRRDRYDQEIRHNDDVFAAMLAKLDALGLRRDTLIVMISDHGEYMGERMMRGHRDPGYVQVTHVPILVRYPAKLPKGLRIPELVELVDVMPTILELAEIDSDGLLMHGESLVDRIQGRRPDYWKSRICLSEDVGNWRSRDATNPAGSIHFGKWHFLATELSLRLLAKIDRRVKKDFGYHLLPRAFYIEAFDREADERELDPSNLFLLDLLLKRRLHDVLGEVQAANMDLWRTLTRGADETIRYDPAAQEQLRALGYIE